MLLKGKPNPVNYHQYETYGKNELDRAIAVTKTVNGLYFEISLLL
jgi:hypothetical protein